MPRVSVVIPCYNRAHLIREAIDSVLAQTFTDFELIVIDDGSTDNTKDVICSISDPRLKYLYQSNKGVSAARNAGIQAAEGEFVAFLDSDDLFLPEKISLQMEVVRNDPAVGFVYSLYYKTQTRGPRKLQGQCYPAGSRHLPLGPRIHLSTVLIQRSWLEQIGGFDEELPVAEDQDLIWRLCMAGCRMVCVPKPLSIRREQEIGLFRDFHQYSAHIMAYVDKIFRDPQIPSELLQLRNSFSAQQYVMLAASAFIAAEPDMGRDMLERALATDPALANQNIDRLVKHYVNFVIGHSVDDPEDTLRLTMHYLPGGRAFTGKFERQSWHIFYVDRAFDAYRSGQPVKCRKYAFRALINNTPLALRNRGLLSILVRSLFRNGSVSDFERQFSDKKESLAE